MKYYKLLRKLLFCISEEKAHHLSIFALQCGLIPNQKRISGKILHQTLWDIDFVNPIGLAAGYDKDAQAIEPLMQQGFSFIETGTATPNPQDGNPKPRLFRLKEDHAIINRMGFNNKGVKNYKTNLQHWDAYKHQKGKYGVVGANIGKNKDSPNTPEDYLTMLNEIYGLSDYITINISSPNTPNLRQMQQGDALEELLSAIAKKHEALKELHNKHIPIMVKIAPDLNKDERKAIAQSIIQHKIDGMIVGNTTVGQREHLKNTRYKEEVGGLSGTPLFKLSTDVLADMYKLTEGKIPIIAAGGVSSAEDAYIKIKNGASLVQIYSSLIYHGFELVPKINKGLIRLLEADGHENITQAIGTDI